MQFWELILIAIGLSMDAMAAAICQGLRTPKGNLKTAILIAAFFGSFQALMPMIGFFLSQSFERSIVGIDHWIAFFLLTCIGGKMLWECFRENRKETSPSPSKQTIQVKEIFILAIATSIDALAVGITLALLSVEPIPAVSTIGIITFLLSFAGVFIGRLFGERFARQAEICGGAILILIGVKILLEHLSILPL